MVGGLVQQQQRTRRDEHLRQRQTTLLATGKHAHALIDVIVFEQERAQQRAHLRHGPGGSHAIKLFKNRVSRVQLLKLMLRVIGFRNLLAEFNGPGIGLQNTSDHFQQRGLAGAIRTDQGDLVAAVHVEVDAVVNDLLAEMLHQAACANDLVAGALGLLEVEVNDLALLGDDDAVLLDLFELLQAILRLLRLGCLVAELLDERLKVGDFLVLLLLLDAQKLKALGASAQIRGIIALVQVDLAVVNFGNAIDHVVHELTVVADDDNGAVVAAKEALQPFDAFKVEVVGGLVQQKQIGVTHQELRQGKAHLPTA